MKKEEDKMLKLTELGKQEVNMYIHKLKDKRNRILSAHKDTANYAHIPNEFDILIDIIIFEEHGKYWNEWECTDHYAADEPLCLDRGIHYLYY